MNAERSAVLAADRAFFDALLAGDGGRLRELLTEDFAIVDVAAGGVTLREAFVLGVESRAVTFQSIETTPEDALVRFYGGTAVVIGRTRMRIAFGESALMAQSRYTHVFHRDGSGALRLASAQGTPIAS